MKHSEEILKRTAGRKMTLSEKQELREALRYEYEQEKRLQEATRDIVKDFKDESFEVLNMPRHRQLNKNPNWKECPICFRITGYNLSYQTDYNAVRKNPDDFCMKPHIHTEYACSLLIQRERIDLDEDGKK